LSIICTPYITVLCLLTPIYFSAPRAHRDLHSFPTRRSSDLSNAMLLAASLIYAAALVALVLVPNAAVILIVLIPTGIAWIAVLSDRKSTRLNSSHQIISYAVFCLKKKRT